MARMDKSVNPEKEGYHVWWHSRGVWADGHAERVHRYSERVRVCQGVSGCARVSVIFLPTHHFHRDLNPNIRYYF